MDSSDAVSVGESEDFPLFSVSKARDEKRAARTASLAADATRNVAARAQAKTELSKSKLEEGAIRKFSLALLVLIAATVATGAAVDSAAAALRVGRNVDFTT